MNKILNDFNFKSFNLNIINNIFLIYISYYSCKFKIQRLFDSKHSNLIGYFLIIFLNECLGLFAKSKAVPKNGCNEVNSNNV